ncbi:MAG: hypothetical protein RLZZ481_2949, partial [Pseudomonadota bacterium]
MNRTNCVLTLAVKTTLFLLSLSPGLALLAQTQTPALSTTEPTTQVAQTTEPSATPTAAKPSAAPPLQGKYQVSAATTSAAFPFLTAENKKLADESWAIYQKDHGLPIKEWAKSEVRFERTGTVFYPFSGPDFVTVNQLYP